jgi:hypothetical protein
MPRLRNKISYNKLTEKPSFTKSFKNNPWIYNHLRAEIARIVKEKRIIELYKKQPPYDNGAGAF